MMMMMMMMMMIKNSQIVPPNWEGRAHPVILLVEYP